MVRRSLFSIDTYSFYDRVRIINIDEDEKRIVLSEREALKEERENILKDLEVGKVYDGVVSGLSSYGLFVTIG